jgi:prepilin signal peptidase PulO-like enzyme (type II secretory pathway)
VLLTRVFRVAERTAVAVAILVALYPPLVVTAQFAWAEPFLPVLVLAAAITLAAVATASQARTAMGWSMACGACAGALYTTHGRTAPIVIVLLGLLAALAMLRRELAPGAIAGMVAAVLVIVAGQLLNNWLRSKSWGPGQDGDLQHVLDNARDLGSFKNVAALGLGQYWYVVVATYGLALLGLAHIGDLLLGGNPSSRHPRLAWAVRRETAGAAVVGAFLLASTIGLSVLVGLFLLPPRRSDHVVYGRYVEILVPPLLALGLVRLWSERTRRVVSELLIGGVVALAAGLIVMRIAGGLVLQTPFNWFTTLALPPLMLTRDQIRPMLATLVASIGAVVLLVVSRWSRALGALGLAVVLLASSLYLRAAVEGIEYEIYDTQPVALSRVEGLNGPHDVGYDVAAYTHRGLYIYQWQLDRTHFVLFDSRRDPVPRTEWVIAGLDWPPARQLGARKVWTHPTSRQAVWRLPGDVDGLPPQRCPTPTGVMEQRCDHRIIG